MLSIRGLIQTSYHCLKNIQGKIRRFLPGVRRMKEARNLLLTWMLYWIIVLLRRSCTLDNEPLQLVPGKDPVRFFARRSPVHDYFRGELHGLTQSLHSNDVTFVFFYASWCLSSATVRPDFETLARTFKNQAAFVAVNCGLHGGQCSSRRRPDHFPLIGAFVTRQKPLFIPFRGFPSKEHLRFFVERILRPLYHIDEQNELEQFLLDNDLAVVAAINPLEPRGLVHFWNASLYMTRHDSRNELKFGIITNSRFAKAVDLPQVNTVGFYCYGKLVQVLSDTDQLAQSHLEEHILRLLKTAPLKWLFPAFHRSTALSEITARNATMLMFMPYRRSPNSSPVLNLMRRVISIYDDCDRGTDCLSLFARDDERSYEKSSQCQETRDRCSILWDQHRETKTLDARLRISLRQNCVCLKRTFDGMHDLCWTGNPFRLPYGSRSEAPELTGKNCGGNHVCFNGFAQSRVYSSCCYSDEIFATDDRQRVMMQLESCREIGDCGSLVFVEKRIDRQVEQHEVANLELIHGLKCLTNRSLAFVALDPITHPAFPKNLDVMLGSQHANLVIIDKLVKPSRSSDAAERSLEKLVLILQASEKYVLNAEVTASSVVNFIYNYSRNHLIANRRSASSNAKSRPSSAVKDGQTRTVRLDEVTADSFSAMLDSPEDVVLFYHAPWCTFCKAVASVFYNLAAKFLDIPGISFKRIDVQKNELPWEYRMVDVPSVQIFPAKWKRDNVATFPLNVPLTLINLLKFTLLHVNSSVWREFVAARCDQKCWIKNLKRSNRLLRSMQRKLKTLRYLRLRDAISLGSTDGRWKWKIDRVKEKLTVLQQLRESKNADRFMSNFFNKLDDKFNSIAASRFLRNHLIAASPS